jgi:hypothetical protein
MVATSIVSLLLIGLSGVMLDMHRRSWRNAQFNQELAANERRYALSQYRRRMQASGIIGALGAAIGCEPLVPREPYWYVLYLVSVTGACFAIVVLALMDAWSSRQHYARIHTEHLTAEIKLTRELADLRKANRADDVAESARK